MRSELFRAEHQRIVLASKQGWDALRRTLRDTAAADLVSVKWDIDYDELGHDVIARYDVRVTAPATYLLQIWAKDLHPGIWIPQFRPWMASIAEFDAADRVTHAGGGFVDSKWRSEDAGQEYRALLWGFVDQGGHLAQFGPYEKTFVFPG